MKEIKMCDLRGQYERLRGEIDAEIDGVMRSADFVRGRRVADFEQALAREMGVEHVITTGSGTDALMLSLMALDLRPGDEVIVPAFTFVATAEVVKRLGMVPRFVDVLYDSMCIDPEAVRRAITPRTRAIVPVHLFGRNADMEALLSFGLPVVEDACQSIGALYKFSDGRRAMSGTMGTMGCTSFFPTKTLGCYGDGGAIFTHDAALADRLRMMANHGSRQRYHHEMVGINSRLDTLQAAVLMAKLPRLGQFIGRRWSVAAYYDKALSLDGRFLLPELLPVGTTNTFHQYTIRCVGEARDAVRERLRRAGVPTAVYYPVPLHLQPAYRTADRLPVSEQLAAEVLSLPMHTELDIEQLSHITHSI